MYDKPEKNGYVESVLKTLRAGDYRQFPLDDVNVQSWRTLVSKANRETGHRRYSVTINRTLGFMAVKNNDREA